eukprot:CAMPEP_0196593092 /NCGR_PEP_ID=MMETSP1081-20130531/74685_1 /TAXON_ID=36882 /ORGANISM="Pyramimonas amylifera, Strain CCMP720" /LENGTH=261 /DNA_ID=CAMNT_0041916973 /DNA_START=38 /DNA_END=823 /DNA_ORIENTATION=+
MSGWLPMDPSSLEGKEATYFIEDETTANINAFAINIEHTQDESSTPNEVSKPIYNSTSYGNSTTSELFHSQEYSDPTEHTTQKEISSLQKQASPKRESILDGQKTLEGVSAPIEEFTVVRHRDGKINLNEYMDKNRSNSTEKEFVLVQESHETVLFSLEDSSQSDKASTSGLRSKGEISSSRGFLSGTPNAVLVANKQCLQHDVENNPESQHVEQIDETLLLSNEILKKIGEMHFSSIDQSEQFQDLLLMFAAEIMESMAT